MIFNYKILPKKALIQLKGDYVNYKDPQNKIEVFPDPKVDGTYAIRVYRKSDDFIFDLLWNKGGFDEVSSEGNEYGFEQWPPISGELKFLL
jgi:hypothetical protein